jgi:hypothetical protein
MLTMKWERSSLMRAKFPRKAPALIAVVGTAALIAAASASAVTVSSFTPGAGRPSVPGSCDGSIITVTGTGFVNDGSTPSVSFNGTPSPTVLVGSDTTLYATVPGTATDGSISVTTAKGTATSATAFHLYQCWGTDRDVTPAVLATVGKISPKTAKVGAAVTVTGHQFTGTKTVTIGGVSGKFTVLSDTRLKVTVPATAKTGKLAITNAAGTTTSGTITVG